MECALGIGWLAALKAVTSASCSASAGPCHIGPEIVREMKFDRRLTSLMHAAERVTSRNVSRSARHPERRMQTDPRSVGDERRIRRPVQNIGEFGAE